MRRGGVSIHAPARGATCDMVANKLTGEFQSTRPRGARLEPLKEYNNKKVSIHAPARGATNDGSGMKDTPRFQSTRPRGARPTASPRSWHLYGFQSTRPRGARRRAAQAGAGGAGFNPRARAGRDVWTAPSRRSATVSIHAPARGATRGLELYHTAQKVSIHAPARGAT